MVIVAVVSVHDDAASPGEPVGVRVGASGPRSAAVRDNAGTIVTGDLHAARRAPLPGPAQIEAPAGLLGLPRRPAPWFVGCDEALAMLAATLEAGTGAGVISQAVVGLGGIGKSELALQYAFAHRLDYALVWWIDADSPAQLQVGPAGLARALVAGSDSVAAGQASGRRRLRVPQHAKAAVRHGFVVVDEADAGVELGVAGEAFSMEAGSASFRPGERRPVMRRVVVTGLSLSGYVISFIMIGRAVSRGLPHPYTRFHPVAVADPTARSGVPYLGVPAGAIPASGSCSLRARRLCIALFSM
ncbi:hypothetical protein ACFWY5_45710 [Nonomuraea sp. NPDC059007]|uniref:hypothetical protein n=1 Tax=Nonomuraea sp. NPDC059007 TaxID=3346692 RepID=UPI003679D003